MLWPRRVRVGVTEHVECALAFAYRKIERLSGPGVGDRHRHSEMTQPSTQITRELDSRTGDGVDVRLLWHPSEDRGQPRCAGQLLPGAA